MGKPIPRILSSTTCVGGLIVRPHRTGMGGDIFQDLNQRASGEGADQRPAHLSHAMVFPFYDILLSVASKKNHLGENTPEEELALSANATYGHGHPGRSGPRC